MANVTAVIFDYYETLAELSTESRVRAFDVFAAQCGLSLAPGEAYEDWRVHTTSDAVARFGSTARPPLDGELPPFVPFAEVWERRFGELFAKWALDASPNVGSRMYCDAHIAAPLYDDARPTIEDLRARYKLAILSDADNAFLHGNPGRRQLGIDTVVTSEELRAYKPHIAMFREVCARLDVEPAEAVYVGDSAWADVAGARHAGLRAVWINRNLIDWPDGIDPPDAMIATLDELPATLTQL